MCGWQQPRCYRRSSGVSADLHSSTQARSLTVATAIKPILPSEESYQARLVEPAIRPLLEALAYEPEVEALSVLYAATSEIVAAVPEAFQPIDAETFVNACLEQIEQMRKSQQESRQQSLEDLSYHEENSSYALEYMSTALRAFIKLSREQFPLDALFKTLNLASRAELGLAGESEWALRLLSDVIEYASPAAMAWSAGFLPFIAQSLHDESESRHQCAASTAESAWRRTNHSTHRCLFSRCCSNERRRLVLQILPV